MAGVRGPRPQVGSAAWISEERSSALQIVDQEIEEFSYSARNELEWINEHMAGILNENEINLAETFKSPGKFRTRTPQTTRKQIAPEPRMPLSDVFASISNGPKPPSSTHTTTRFQSPHIHALTRPTPLNVRPTSPRREPILSPTKSAPSLVLPAQDSGHHGSQTANSPDHKRGQGASQLETTTNHPNLSTSTPLRQSPTKQIAHDSPVKAFQATREEEVPGPANENQDGYDERHEDGDEHDDYIESHTPPESPTAALEAQNEAISDDARSSSEASSPVRPLGRKSSLNFASLPAREPLAGGRSLGGGLSRIGQTENGNNRTSYYQRAAGGKSLGNGAKGDLPQDAGDNAMAVDNTQSAAAPEAERQPLTHSKTYTQRLQDQISLLGKAQVKAALSVTATVPPNVVADEPKAALDSPKKDPAPTTPGAFADDDDEDWIDPPKTLDETLKTAPPLSKSFTAEIMEGIHEKNAFGQSDFNGTKTHQGDLPSSPQKFASVGRGFRDVLGHNKTPSLATMSANSLLSGDSQALVQPTSDPDPAPSADHGTDTPSKSPVRNTRESPLKHVKNKLSSILKSSRGLLASSAATGADGKSIMSPSTSRLALHLGPSSEFVMTKPQSEIPESDTQSLEETTTSPGKPIARRTRASTEREKEEKRREREARFMADQNDKLDRAREEEREKARVFGKEQEQVAAMEKKVASKNQQERFAARVSPEKAKAKDEAELRHAEVDVEMTDGGSGPATKIGGLGQLNQTKEGKRPVRPTKEAIPKAKQAPTVIRVNTSSQTTQYGSRASTASHDTGGMSSSQASSRGSKITLQSKSSSQNLKALPTAVRPKALDMSVKKREQEEREVQRRREAKAEIERKRAAIQEEQRRHAEKQRQVAAEKAKQTRAPTSAMRSHTNIHTNIPSEGGFGQQRGEPSRPPSRMTSGMPVSTTFSSAVKTGAKRALAHDAGDEGQAKRPVSRGGPSYQAKDGKRRRTSEVVNDPEVGPVRNIKGPPVRPSNGFKKDMAPKTVFQSGYTNAPPPHSATRDLFKATVTAQHNSQVKGSHPLDLAQISKGPIPFAANTGAPGSSYKTPARIGSFAAGKSTAKKATRSSPRFQSGETIELPEIQTDDEDEDDDAQAMMVAAWADSPDLRRALIRQETLDPSQIFGPPAPLDMEEVFNKSKDKWHKFRQRTSSANWNGLDRLTEEDIRKDMAAREKLRRDGGWSYEMSKNL